MQRRNGCEPQTRSLNGPGGGTSGNRTAPVPSISHTGQGRPIADNGSNEDNASHYLLPKALNAGNAQTVLQYANEKNADGRTPHTSDATRQCGTTQQDRCDGLEGKIGVDIGCSDADPTDCY